VGRLLIYHILVLLRHQRYNTISLVVEYIDNKTVIFLFLLSRYLKQNRYFLISVLKVS